MSFKSAANELRNDIAAGAFKKKTDVWGGFADQVVSGLRSRSEDRRAEELLIRREGRADARDAKARQDTANRADKLKQDALDKQNLKDKDTINYLYQSLGGNLNSINQKWYSDIETVVKIRGAEGALQYLSDQWGNKTPLKDLEGTQKQVGTELPVSTVTTLETQTNEIFNAEKAPEPALVDADGVSELALDTSPVPKPRPTDLSLPLDTSEATDTLSLFGGPPPVYDLKSVTANNYIGVMAQLTANGDTEQAEQVRKVAEQNGWTNTAFDLATVTENNWIGIVSGLEAAGKGKDAAAVRRVADDNGWTNKAFDLSTVTENNWIGMIKTLDLAGKGEDAAAVRLVAKENGWDNKAGGVPKSDMWGANAAKWQDALASATTTEDQAYFQAGFDAATEREKEPRFWQDPTKLAAMNADTLDAHLTAGAYEEGTDAFKAINDFLLIRRVQEGSAGVETLIGADPQKIDQFIRINRATLTNEQLNTLTDIRSVAEEYKAKGDLSGSAKQIAQQSFIEANDVAALTGNARINIMAQFERDWADSVKTVADKQGSYTDANYTSDIIKYSEMLLSGDATSVSEAVKWMTVTKPLIEGTMSSIATMDKSAQVKLLTDAGMAKNDATSLVMGGTKIISQLGRSYLVNEITGAATLIQTTSTDAQEQTAVDRAAIEGGQIGLPSDLTSDSIVYVNPNTNEPVVITAKDKQDAAATMQDLGFMSEVGNLKDLTSAFGAKGWFAKNVNALTGVFNTNLMPDSAKASATLKALKTVTTLQLVTAFPGIRDSVQLKTQIGSLIPDTGQFWSNEVEAKNKFGQVKAAIDTAILNQRSIAASTEVSATQAAAATVALKALVPLSATYGAVISAFGSEGGSASDSFTTNLFDQPPPTLEEYSVKARVENPNATDAQILEHYNDRFGG